MQLDEPFAKAVPGTDISPPSIPSDTLTFAPIQFPSKWLIDESNRQQALGIYAKTGSGYFAFGGNAFYASDGMDSLPDIYRKSGVWFPLVMDDDDEQYNKYWESFEEIYEVKAGKSSLPSSVSHNHVGPDVRGPKKAEWKNGEVVPCPTHLSQNERDKVCFSLLDVIFGEDLLHELIEFKFEIDPMGIFQAYGTVSAACVDDPNFEYVFTNKKGIAKGKGE